MKIIAFPYAFGSAGIYHEFKCKLESKIDFQAFDYPGHGSRIVEEPLYTIEDIVNDSFRLIKDSVSEPYCLLGYSMGGLVAFGLYKKLKMNRMTLPKHIFLLASCEPSYKFIYEDYENYTLEDVKDILRYRNGTSEEVLAENELIELIAPAVKADSIALRDYNCTPEELTEDGCGVTVVRGNAEPEIKRCHEEWERYFQRKIEYIVVEGDHFFLFKEGEKMLTKLSDIIISKLEAF